MLGSLTMLIVALGSTSRVVNSLSWGSRSNQVSNFVCFIFSILYSWHIHHDWYSCCRKWGQLACGSALLCFDSQPSVYLQLTILLYAMSIWTAFPSANIFVFTNNEGGRNSSDHDVHAVGTLKGAINWITEQTSFPKFWSLPGLVRGVR